MKLSDDLIHELDGLGFSGPRECFAAIECERCGATVRRHYVTDENDGAFQWCETCAVAAATKSIERARRRAERAT